MQINLIPRVHPVWLLLAAFFIFLPQLLAAEENAEVRALLTPEVEATLSSQIAARIIAIKVQEGDRFQVNKPLVEFDCSILKAQLQKSHIDQEAAEEIYQANRQLEEYGSGSKMEITVAGAKKKLAQAEVLVNETWVERCLVKAPFAGRVVKLLVHPFESVAPGDPLLELIDDSRLKLRLLIPSHWLIWLKTGALFTVRIDETGQEYSAKITRIGARVNPANQTIEVDGAIKGHRPELLAGMSGTAIFKLPDGKK